MKAIADLVGLTPTASLAQFSMVFQLFSSIHQDSGESIAVGFSQFLRMRGRHARGIRALP